MDLESCNQCGLVMDMRKVNFIPMELPDDPSDDAVDEDGYLITEETHHNPDLIWGDIGPIDTWQCPICKHFNGYRN